MTQEANDRIATSERLARDLEALKDTRLDKMIGQARRGYYDDFKSELSFPIRQLVTDLRHYGYDGMAQRAVNGHYDAEAWEAEDWMMGDEAQEIMAEVFGL